MNEAAFVVVPCQKSDPEGRDGGRRCTHVTAGGRCEVGHAVQLSVAHEQNESMDTPFVDVCASSADGRRITDDTFCGQSHTAVIRRQEHVVAAKSH